MTHRPYEVLGKREAPMRGRSRQLEALLRQLFKATPEHVSLIGPKHIGKTLFLKHLVARVRAEPEKYLTAIYWNVRHGAPETDAAFRKRLAEEVAAAIVPVRDDFRDEAYDFDWLKDVVDILKEEGKRILVVLDGFDRILAATGITRNLWDSLLDLAQKESLWLVTGSRRPLRAICAAEDSRTSEFWQIFNPTPHTLGPFDTSDWDDLLQPLGARRTIEDGARKEIVNWTGGVPLLAAALALRLLDLHGASALTKADVDRAAGEILADTPLLEELWDDCTEELKGDLVDLAHAPLPNSRIPEARRAALVGRGYATDGGSQLKASCRLMEAFARANGPGVSDLRRLFGAPSDYTKNVRAALELRLGHVQATNADLRSAVEKALRELDPQDPAGSFVWFRTITERALKAIWSAEAPGGRLSAGWGRELQAAGFTSLPADGSLPRGPGAQCRALDIATGTQNSGPFTRYLSKPSFILLDTLKQAGDFGQHQGDVVVTIALAASLCLCAVELLDALTRELP